MKKFFTLFAVLIWAVMAATVLAKDLSKVKCCVPTKSKKVRCVEMTKPECKNQHGRVVNNCADCK